MRCPMCKGTGILTEEEFKAYYTALIVIARERKVKMREHDYEELKRDCPSCEGKGQVKIRKLAKIKAQQKIINMAMQRHKSRGKK